VYTINAITEESERASPGLFRVAHKMTTGSSKTVGQAMIIAGPTVNKALNGRIRHTGTSLHPPA
jgi:hypothetical protein